MYKYIHVYTFIHTCTNIYMYIHLYIHLHTRVYIYTNTQIRIIYNQIHNVQGGEDPQNALNCMSFSAKEPLMLGLFWGNWPTQIWLSSGEIHNVKSTTCICIHVYVNRFDFRLFRIWFYMMHIWCIRLHVYVHG